MTAKSSRRVVIINNIKSDRIEQAIFILRGDKDGKPSSFVLQEAQEIIDNYIHKIKEGDPFIKEAYPKKRNRAGLISAVIVLGMLSLVVAFKFLVG